MNLLWLALDQPPYSSKDSKEALKKMKEFVDFQLDDIVFAWGFNSRTGHCGTRSKSLFAKLV